MILGFLLRNRYIFAVIGAVAALVSLYFFGYNNGVLKARGACEVEKVNAINNNINIREEQDRVITFDDAALADSMRRGSF